MKKPWRRNNDQNSLSESFASIHIPTDGSFWKKLFAFAGPGLMVAVGYMDPGNWATDIAGGSQFGYTLLSVILLSNISLLMNDSLFNFVEFSIFKAIFSAALYLIANAIHILIGSLKSISSLHNV